MGAMLFIGIALYFGKAAQLVEVIAGQIVGCYLLVGTLGELYVHLTLLSGDVAARRRRMAQSHQEILVATEALLGVCAFSCCVYEIFDPIFCPFFGYFPNPITNSPGTHEYTIGWCAANCAFYLLFCDAWFFWWHYAFHQLESLW